MSIVLNQKTQQTYNHYVSNLPHALLVVAPEGSGKKTIIINLVKDILQKDYSVGLNLIEPPEGKEQIGIDQIRELKANSSLSSKHKKIYVIIDSDNLSHEAQNSLLKVLEDTPKDTHIILSVHNINNLITTIKSRTAIWNILNPTRDQILDFFKEEYAEDKINRAISLSDCRMGLISAILSSNDDHQLLQSIELAKEILSEKPYERLCRVDQLSKDPKKTDLLLEAMVIACKAAMESSAKNSQLINRNKTVKWLKITQNIVSAQQDLSINVSPKLVLGRLFLMI